MISRRRARRPDRHQNHRAAVCARSTSGPSLSTSPLVAGNIIGVTGVQNDIYLDVATPYASDVKHSIKKAFARNAKLDAKNIDVQTVDGTAILTGRMSSWAGHDTAVAAAW